MHVFVSYARSDTAYVDRLVAHLTAQGIPVWVDRDNLRAGDRWERLIAEKVETCSAFVLVMTPAAADSHWVGVELQHALSLRKPVLPLLLAGKPLFAVTTLEYEDVTDGQLPSPRFVHRLAALTGTAEIPAATTTTTAAAVPPRRVVGLRPRPGPALETEMVVLSMAAEPATGRLCAGGTRGELAIFDLATAARLTLDGHGDSVTSVAVTSDGRLLASASEDSTVRLWDIQSGAGRATLVGHSAPVTAVAFAPDDTWLASGCVDGTVKIWRTADASATTPARLTLTGHDDGVTALRVAPAGWIATASVDGTVRVWDSATGDERIKLNGPGGSIEAMTMSRDGTRVVLGGQFGVVQVWNTISGHVDITVDADEATPCALALTSDNSLLVVARTDNTISLWDIQAGVRLVTEYAGDYMPTFCLVMLPGDDAFLASEGGLVRTWDFLQVGAGAA